MIYMEFIDWHRQIPAEVFRLLVRQDQWHDEADTKAINIGRHKGLGPSPAYLSGWRIRGFDRLDEWETFFKSDEAQADISEKATFLALDFRCCGLYDELVAGDLPNANLHAVEYVDAPEEIEDSALADHFHARESAHAGATLAHLLRRVGLLGPQAGDLAIWTFADFAAGEGLLRERQGDHPLARRAIGLYRNIGHELM